MFVLVCISNWHHAKVCCFAIVCREKRANRRLPRPETARLLLGLEVVEEDGALLRLLTPVLDDNARAVDDLAGVALAVDLACTGK